MEVAKGAKKGAKKEVNELSMTDALDIYVGLELKGTDIKVTVRDYLKKNKLSVSQALINVEKANSSKPKHKRF